MRVNRFFFIYLHSQWSQRLLCQCYKITLFPDSLIEIFEIFFFFFVYVMPELFSDEINFVLTTVLRHRPFLSPPAIVVTLNSILRFQISVRVQIKTKNGVKNLIVNYVWEKQQTASCSSLLPSHSNTGCSRVCSVNVKNATFPRTGTMTKKRNETSM